MGQKGRLTSLLLSYAVGILILLFLADINSFPLILTGYALGFAAYYFLVKELPSLSIGLKIGWTVRIVSIFAFPQLSDDIYRFIWDGWLITEHTNPFAYLPTAVPQNLEPFQKFLLTSMNSPEYYSVYPMVLQLLFAGVVYIIPANIFAQSILLKIILLGFEMLTVRYSIKILDHFGQDRRLLLLYFLNPLIVVELMGNLHMELVMISGFALFLYYFFCRARGPKRYVLSAFALSFSIGAKLITLLAAPFLVKRLWERRSLRKFMEFFSWLTVFMLVLFVPIIVLNYQNFGKGLDLYFQKFEFNASVYYIIRTIGFWVKGYNIIGSLGPVLAICSSLLILGIAGTESSKSIESLSTRLIFALCVYYFLSTTVHPWYTALLVYLAIFSGYRFVLFWSFLAILSYSKYYDNGQLYYWAVALEYFLLASVIMYEWYVKQLDKRRTYLASLHLFRSTDPSRQK